MKENNNNNAFAYVAIVAIVAIMAIFVMFAGNNKEIETPNLSGNDIVGDATGGPTRHGNCYSINLYDGGEIDGPEIPSGFCLVCPGGTNCYDGEWFNIPTTVETADLGI